jgi:hypothetical protein
MRPTEPSEPCLTLTTEQLAQRWGCHPETIKRAVRNGTCPVKPIIPHGKWAFSRAAIERAELATALPVAASDPYVNSPSSLSAAS